MTSTRRKQGAPYEIRFICLACAVELRPVRIGVWRCPACATIGPLSEPPLSGQFSSVATQLANTDVPIGEFPYWKDPTQVVVVPRNDSPLGEFLS